LEDDDPEEFLRSEIVDVVDVEIESMVILG
jgi:hypothetical protein